MSDVDAVMLLELENKITNRIREEFVKCVHGIEDVTHLGKYTKDGLIDVNNVHMALVDDMSESVLALVRAKLFTNKSVIAELKMRLKNLEEEENGKHNSR